MVQGLAQAQQARLRYTLGAGGLAVFLCLILTGVWAAYGVFTKKFTDYDEVTLKSSKIGLSLPTILAAVGETGADLVVMGTHGYGALGRLIMGSVASNTAVGRSDISSQGSGCS